MSHRLACFLGVLLGTALGLAATQACATERILFSFNSDGERNSWVELAGTWKVARGKYVGKPGRDFEAVSGYNAISGALSTLQGRVILNAPAGGSGFIVLRGRTRTEPNGDRGVSGYLVGLQNRSKNTFLRIVRISSEGEEILCNRNVKLSEPDDLQSITVQASGSTLIARLGEVECRGFDRTFGEGFFGLLTRGGSKKSAFQVEFIDVLSK